MFRNLNDRFQKDSGMALVVVLVGITILTVLVSLVLRSSQNSMGSSKTEILKKQATLAAIQGIDLARKSIKEKLNTILYLCPDPAKVQGLSIKDIAICGKYQNQNTIDMSDLYSASADFDHQAIRITPVGEGTEGSFQASVTKSTVLPKLIRIQNQANSPDGSVRASVTQTISFEKTSAYEFSYILSNQNADLTIGGPATFQGQAVIAFDNPTTSKLKFDLSQGNVDFYQQLQTNLKDSSGLVIPTASGKVNFSGGVIFNSASTISEILKKQADQIRTDPDTINLSHGLGTASSTLSFWVDPGSNVCSYELIQSIYQ